MKIQVIAHNREKNPPVKMRWHWLPFYFEKFGYEVDHVLKKDWKYFYVKYLKFKPDVLISAGPIAFIPTLLKRLKIMNVVHVHDWTDDNVDINWEYGITKMALFEYFTVEHADVITTPSVFRKERCELWGKRVFFIPHGVSEDFDKKEPVELKGDIKVLYAGEISRRKRVDKLIKAVKNLNCELYIIGKIKEEFMKIAPPNVHFLGYIPQDEIPRYLKAADILVLTADDDCTLKMYEYIKAGKAILGIRGKLNYVLTHMENAYLTDDLFSGLKKLIEDDDLRMRLARNVRRMKVYTWKEIAKMYLNTLKFILGG